MADDIFDKAAASSGDIFDKVATQTPEQQAPNAVAQAQSAIRSKIQPQTDFLSNLAGPTPRPIGGGEENMLATGAAPAAKGMIEMGAGGEALAAAKGLPLIARMAALGGGTGVGNLVGSAVTGEMPNPREAAKTAITTGAAGTVLEPIASLAGKAIGKLSGKSASELAELSQLPQREEEIRQRIVQGYQAARRTAGAAYPEIVTPVNLAGPREVAREGASNLVAHGTPRLVGQVAGTVDKGAEFLKVASNYHAAMGENLADPSVIQGIANNLSSNTPVPFKDAQQIYSALGETIAKGRGRLPGEVYASLKSVRDAIGDGMKAAAQADGKLAEFTKAQKGWSKLMDDWMNPGAPMKQMTSGAAKRQFAVMKKFLGDDGGRIVKTMDKYGIETRDIQAFQQLGQETARGKVNDAAELARMGTQAFQAQAGQAAKAEAFRRAGQIAKPLIGGGLGGGALYEILRNRR